VSSAGVSPDKIAVIPNGVNEHVLKDLDSRLAAQEHADEIMIGFTGFIHPWHGLDKALEAIASVRDKRLRFLCVGEGDIRPQLENQARQLGIEDQVQFTGLVSRENVFEYVSKFDIALQPSVTEYASPLKLFEYMACGTIVIAPDMPNIREILDDQSALLFNPEDETGFRTQLLFAIENYDSLSQMRASVRGLIDTKKLTWQNNAAKVVDLVTPFESG